MKIEDWQSLAGNPGWEAFKAYLTANREKIKEGLAEGRYKTLDAVQEAVAFCQVYKDMVEMDWPTIEKFYKQDDNIIYKATERP